MVETEFHFDYYYDSRRKLHHRTIFMRYYSSSGILELHCEKGIPIKWFMTIKKHLEIRTPKIELRVV